MAGDVAGDYLLKGLIHMGPPNLEIPKPKLEFGTNTI
jgi:hypothetical protein